MSSDFDQRVADTAQNTEHLGELPDADSVGTAGNADCGDLLRVWLKFREEDGRKVIDRASFQTFGCQTAIAVASIAAGLLKGKTKAEALDLSGADLAAPLGPLPPMKIHCAQLVESALKSALEGERSDSEPEPLPAPTLLDSFSQPGGFKIVLQNPK